MMADLCPKYEQCSPLYVIWKDQYKGKQADLASRLCAKGLPVKVGHRGHIPAHELKTRGVNAAFTNNTSVETLVYETHGILDNALQCADNPYDIWI